MSGLRIAIIGSGISGLVAARELARENEVTVFEAGDDIGGHTDTIDVESGGERHAVDTGFIVYNERFYPHFSRLLRDLGVATNETDMGFSVRCDRTGIEWCGSNLNAVFAQRRNLFRPRFWRMLRDIFRFGREASRALETLDDQTTVAEFVSDHGYSRSFLDLYLVPLGAALWSSPVETFRRFPIRFVIEFLHNHSMLQIGGRPVWRVIEGGSRNYVEPLVRPFRESIRLQCPVREVTRLPFGVSVAHAGGSELFDEVVFACHADQALRLLDDPSATEREVLAAFPYQVNDAVLHTDERLLPRSRRARAAWNYHLRADRADHATVTYDMNTLQGIRSPHRFCVTLNETDAIDPARVIRRIRYEHPLFTAGRRAAQQRHAELIRVQRTSFCGAYWGYGFHEDGVRSALAVAHAFAGVTVR